jgi:hypothetical protein
MGPGKATVVRDTPDHCQLDADALPFAHSLNEKTHTQSSPGRYRDW